MKPVSLDAINRLQRRASAKLARGTGPRTFQKVRRNSRHRGERERTFWRPVDPLKLRAIVEAAKLEEVQTKKKGKRNGVLGASAIRVLEVMVDIVDWADGTLEPSYRYIQKRTGLAIDTIWKALGRLKECGYLEWIRRTQPVQDDGTGRTVEQIENAYRLLVPRGWRDRVAMRVEQWRASAAKAKERWRSHAEEREARRDHAEAERRRKARAWANEAIADPSLRQALLDDLAKGKS